jgi:thymidylate synthase (FAD)
VETYEGVSADEHTDLRKKVQQTAHSVLPNETEALIVVTGSAHTQTEIRELAVRVFLCLYLTDPVLLSDYTLEKLPDGTFTVKAEFEKI